LDPLSQLLLTFLFIFLAQVLAEGVTVPSIPVLKSEVFRLVGDFAFLGASLKSWAMVKWLDVRRDSFVQLLRSTSSFRCVPRF